jgi:hypothetical protein
MRVGVVADNASPEAGGVFTFVSAVVEAIKQCSSEREFVIWESALQRDAESRWREVVKRSADLVGAGRLIRITAGRIKAVKAAKAAFTPIEISRIERFVQESDIDMMWFVSQRDEPVSVPYLTTVWDLQYRREPFFPEVRTTGWAWEARERTFRSNLPRASRIITSTKISKSEILTFYGVSPENVVVVPMPVAVSEDRTDAGGHVDVRRKCGLMRDFIFYPAQF